MTSTSTLAPPSRPGPASQTDSPTRRSATDPAWARPALVVLLLGTGVLYLWGLGESGWANSFYSAAAQAGSESWKAFFFGSSDAANSITVDKTPLALWPMALSVRIFGLSSWSILLPQALAGVATVGLLHHVVRRTTGSAAAGLLAGTVMALTPVAVLMFRFNNPDALLTLLMVGAAAATLRGIEATRAPASHPARWLALGGALVGLGFLTKMMQAFLVLPALALVYLLFAQTSWGRKVGHLLVAFGSMLLAGGWWIAIVELWPAASRPYIGGSQTNSILELTLGYNGLGRLSGNETGAVVGGGAAGGRQWGSTGLLRLFGSDLGGQIAWLLPAALVLGVAALWFARRHIAVRAALVLWMTWLLVTALTFSFMAGIFHAYYTVALAPAVAALIGIGATVLWQHRRSYVASGTLALTVTLTSGLSWILLDRSSDYLPWLKWAVAGLGLAAALVLAGVAHLPHRVGLAAAVLALTATLAGPAAYSYTTASTPHTGSIPSAGPAVADGARGGPGGQGGPGGGGRGGPPTGQAGGRTAGQAAGQTTGQTAGQAAGRAGGPGGAGGLLEGSTPSAELTALLQQDAGSYTWAAAAVGANTAAGYQLASELPVMPIGGFNGSDPSPTLAQFKQYVADGEVHWFIGGGNSRGQGADAEGSSAIAEWVSASYTATTVDGITLYDLSGSLG